MVLSSGSRSINLFSGSIPAFGGFAFYSIVKELFPGCLITFACRADSPGLFLARLDHLRQRSRYHVVPSWFSRSFHPWAVGITVSARLEFDRTIIILHRRYFLSGGLHSRLLSIRAWILFRCIIQIVHSSYPVFWQRRWRYKSELPGKVGACRIPTPHWKYIKPESIASFSKLNSKDHRDQNFLLWPCKADCKDKNISFLPFIWLFRWGNHPVILLGIAFHIFLPPTFVLKGLGRGIQ